MERRRLAIVDDSTPARVGATSSARAESSCHICSDVLMLCGSNVQSPGSALAVIAIRNGAIAMVRNSVERMLPPNVRDGLFYATSRSKDDHGTQIRCTRAFRSRMARHAPHVFLRRLSR